jgi:hypothetical protein
MFLQYAQLVVLRNNFYCKFFFYVKKKTFVMCKKISYQTILCLTRKKQLYEVIQFTFFYYIRFCNT